MGQGLMRASCPRHVWTALLPQYPSPLLSHQLQFKKALAQRGTGCARLHFQTYGTLPMSSRPFHNNEGCDHATGEASFEARAHNQSRRRQRHSVQPDWDFRWGEAHPRTRYPLLISRNLTTSRPISASFLAKRKWPTSVSPRSISSIRKSLAATCSTRLCCPPRLRWLPWLPRLRGAWLRCAWLRWLRGLRGSAAAAQAGDAAAYARFRDLADER